MKIIFAKSIVLVFVYFTIILLSNIQFLNITIFSQEDDKKGFGVQERERAGIHADKKGNVQEYMLVTTLELMMIKKDLEYKKENVQEYMLVTTLEFLIMIILV